jgi:pimeloyl-ACP methyl ester carboxylesterase
MRGVRFPFALALCAALAGCESRPDERTMACDAEPVIRTTALGVQFVRTPDACFAALPDWPYAPLYVEIDGLRQAYVDEGPAAGPVVLLLHGQPSWSYLYRKMIPVLADAGFRVIAMDHLGMGRSDKPVDLASYSYLGHNDRLLRFIEALDLRDINLFVQDWGSLIGLRVAGLHPERFARIAVGDGRLPVVPAGYQPFPPVENPDEIADVTPPFAAIPAQQVPFYDGCEKNAGLPDSSYFAEWMIYAMKGRDFRPSLVVEAMTWFDLPDDEAAAYDAPFPSRTYLAGARVFPSLANELPGVNDDAWAGLAAFARPFLTLWAANDPGQLGGCEVQQELVDSVPGAAGRHHDRLPAASHFLQDDQGPEIARRLVDFYSDRSGRAAESKRGTRYCEILLGYLVGSEIHAEVWGTQGLSLCPAASWEALDPDSIKAQYGAQFIEMNGPRAWVIDAGSGELPDAEHRWYGDLEMQRLATVVVDPAQVSAGPYHEARVERTTVFELWSGFEVFELTAPDGAVYVMQAMSQIVDPSLTLADLPRLGARLALPEGWTFRVDRRITDLVLAVDGEVFVLQDELKNTYMRTSAGSPSPTLPVLDDGTGTPCSSDGDCQGLTAAHCLVSAQASYCTVEGCAPGGCGAPYVCCHSCNPALASFLPFAGSACIPEVGTGLLTSQAGCTCE